MMVDLLNKLLLLGLLVDGSTVTCAWRCLFLLAISAAVLSLCLHSTLSHRLNFRQVALTDAATHSAVSCCVVGKIAEAVLSVSVMNVRCTCKQAWLDERRGPLEPMAHCDMKVPGLDESAFCWAVSTSDSCSIA